VQLTCDAYPDQKFDGVLTAINPDLDSTTRSVALRATLENTNQLLRPGMFVRVAVTLPQAEAVLAVPATAILSAPFGDSVYVIEQSTNSGGGLIARQQFVRTGQTHGNSISVLTGLKAGDRVVSAGLFKLHNGAPVTINNDIVPPTVKNPSDS
jgi:membrane fusion protein (multidrug efflux system)